MRSGLVLALAAALIWGACAHGLERESAPPQVEAAVDLDRYLGRWYEIARYPNRFERGCVGVTADYGLRPDGRISVTNTCRIDTLDGAVKVAEGRARVVDPSNAKLKVKFAPDWAPFASGDYWILDVDPDYQSALVGAPNRQFLWILAREPQLDQARRRELEELARANGFDPARLEEVPQALNDDAAGLDAELSRILAVLPGLYESEARAETPANEPVHMLVREITARSSHERAVFLRMRREGPEGPVYRDRIQVFDVSPGRAANTMISLPLVSPGAGDTLLVDREAFARGDVRVGAEMGPAEGQGCRQTWRADGTGFIARVEPETCVITGKRGDQRRIEGETRLSADAIGLIERGFDLSGTQLFGSPPGAVSVWRRVEPAAAAQ